jgi:hypothetical protein
MKLPDYDEWVEYGYQDAQKEWLENRKTVHLFDGNKPSHERLRFITGETFSHDAKMRKHYTQGWKNFTDKIKLHGLVRFNNGSHGTQCMRKLKIPCELIHSVRGDCIYSFKDADVDAIKHLLKTNAVIGLKFEG